jgi:hypothetical protein
MSVYFWKTQQLADDIKSNKISEKSKMYYYLIMMVLFDFIAYLYLVEGLDTVSTTIVISEMLSVIIVTIAGILITFKTNKGEDGVDYIARVIMLAFPISIKIFIFMMIFDVALLGIVFYYFDFDEWSDLFVSLQTVLVSILLYWRINVYLKYINQS